MVDDIFPSQPQNPKRVSECEVGTRKSSGIEDAQEIGSRPSQQTLSEGVPGEIEALPGPSFSAESTPPSTVCIPPRERITAGLEAFSLPGKGSRAEGCGRLTSYHCGIDDRSFLKGSHCNERGCPRCFERWARKEAHEAARRVVWGSKVVAPTVPVFFQYHPFKSGRLYESPGGDLRNVHLIVSLKEHPGTSVRAYRQDAYRILRDHNIEGGAVVIHPFRKDDYDAAYTLDGYVHFHCPGMNFEDIPPGGTDFDSEGELAIFKHIPDSEYGDYRGFRSQLAVERELTYLLSHAGVAEGFHSLTYFGSLAPCKLSADDIQAVYEDSLLDGGKADPIEPGPGCPLCGSHETEPCTLITHVYDELPSSVEPSVMQPRKWVGVVEEVLHPEPEYAGTPGVLEERRRIILEEYERRRVTPEKCERRLVILEKYEFLYQIEHDFRRRRELKHARQRELAMLHHEDTVWRRHELARLDREETVWLNFNDPFVRLWAALHDLFRNGVAVLEAPLAVPDDGPDLPVKCRHSFDIGEIRSLIKVDSVPGLDDFLKAQAKVVLDSLIHWYLDQELMSLRFEQPYDPMDSAYEWGLESRRLEQPYDPVDSLKDWYLKSERFRLLQDPLNALIEWNLKSRRLEQLESGRFRLRWEFGLDDALKEMRSIYFHDEADGDWRLERLLRANPLKDEESEVRSEILTDTGFVFGGLLERYHAQDCACSEGC